VLLLVSSFKKQFFIYQFIYLFKPLYSGCLPATLLVDLRRWNFFDNLAVHNDSLHHVLFLWFGQNEYTELNNKYDCGTLDSRSEKTGKSGKV